MLFTKGVIVTVKSVLAISVMVPPTELITLVSEVPITPFGLVAVAPVTWYPEAGIT
jgi:hypothetical protein